MTFYLRKIVVDDEFCEKLVKILTLITASLLNAFIVRRAIISIPWLLMLARGRTSWKPRYLFDGSNFPA